MITLASERSASLTHSVKAPADAQDANATDAANPDDTCHVKTQLKTPLLVELVTQRQWEQCWLANVCIQCLLTPLPSIVVMHAPRSSPSAATCPEQPS